MAALLINSASRAIDMRTASARRLKDWLAGDWAVLLSDAEDFAPHPTTPASFLARLHSEFLDRRTRLLALARDTWRADESWIRDVSADDSLLMFGDGRGDECADLASHALRTELGRLERPFALALDARGRIRLTIRYSRANGHSKRTVAEILQMIDALKPDKGSPARLSEAEVSGW